MAPGSGVMVHLPTVGRCRGLILKIFNSDGWPGRGSMEKMWCSKARKRVFNQFPVWRSLNECDWRELGWPELDFRMLLRIVSSLNPTSHFFSATTGTSSFRDETGTTPNQSHPSKSKSASLQITQHHPTASLLTPPASCS